MCVWMAGSGHPSNETQKNKHQQLGKCLCPGKLSPCYWFTYCPWYPVSILIDSLVLYRHRQHIIMGQMVIYIPHSVIIVSKSTWYSSRLLLISFLLRILVCPLATETKYLWFHESSNLSEEFHQNISVYHSVQHIVARRYLATRKLNPP